MKLSIITVVYNGEKVIERAIKSVIRQKNADIEYIIVDGGSTDHTLDIITVYKDYITRMVSEPDQGIYDAMNKGAKLVTGDIVTFLNCDDWYEENVLQDVIGVFERNEIDILCTDARIVNEYGSRIRSARLDGKTIIKQLPTSHQAIFATRKCFADVGEFNLKYSVSADFDWMTRSIIMNRKIEILHKTVVNFSTGGFSTDHSELCYEEIKEISFKYYSGTPLECDVKKYYAYKDYMRTGKEEDWEKGGFSEAILKLSIPDKKNIYLFGMGKVGAECCKLLEKLGYVITGFIDNYINYRQVSYMGKKIQIPEKMQAGKDYIIIASTKYEDDMKIQMKKMGFCEDRDFSTYTKIQEQVIYRDGLQS